jgi:O-antigen ligase
LVTSVILGIIKKSYPIPQKKYFLIFLFICFLSLILSVRLFQLEYVFSGSLYLLRLISIFSIYPLIKLSSQKQKIFITACAYFVGMAISLIGLIKYFFYPNLKNLYYLGWDDHLYRLFSVFLDPNFTGIFLAFFIFFILYMITSKKLNKKQIALHFLAIIIGGLTLFLTYSRTSYLTLIIGLITFAILLPKNKKIAITTAGIALGAILIVLLFFRRLEGTNLLRNGSVFARIGSDRQAIDVFLKHPIFGIGFDTYRFAQHEKGSIASKNWQTTHAGASPDNSYLLVLATTGLAGLGIYLLFWSNLLMVQKNILAKSTIVSFLVSGLFINSLFYPFLLVWVLMIIATENNLP